MEEIKGILIVGEYLFKIEFVYDFSIFFLKNLVTQFTREKIFERKRM